FAKFVEWPAHAFTSADEPIILGILGADPFGNSLKPLEEKTAGGRRLAIKRFPSAEALEKCHILFVSRSSVKDLSQILTTARNWNVLTVGETRGFTEAGGIINFILVVIAYLEDAPRRLEQLREAISAMNAPAIREVAHSLKSSSANLGALNLSSLFKELEMMSRSHSLEKASELLSKIEIEYVAVEAALKAELGGRM
ncbi:MAG: YfiR/HmsC family protein, partial [candidate division NC10 bacterium]|nr:YfiR/HmsC family protein [candidate division NC10 bacterium]